MGRIGVMTGLVAAGMLGGGALAGDVYFLTPLGDLPGGDFFSVARGINDLGQVVGGSDTDGGGRAYIWEEGVGMQSIADPFLGGYFSSRAEDINNSGLISGNYTEAPGGQENSQAFLWDGVDFLAPFEGDPQVEWSRGGGVNDNGVAVGWLKTTPLVGQAQLGFVYDTNTNTLNELLGPGRANTVVVKQVNNAGHAVGRWAENGGSAYTAAMWDVTTSDRTDIPHLAGFDFNRSSAINEAGMVIGASANDSEFNDRNPWMWNPGDPDVTPLGLLAGFDSMAANGLSEDGLMVIGTAFNDEVGDGVGAIWTSGDGWVDINSLIDETGDGFTVVELRGINADGWIIGDAIIDGTGEMEAVLIRIVPAPASFALFGLAGLFFGRRRPRD